MWNRSGSVHAVERDADVCRSLFAHGELCLEVVAGGDGGHHVDRA